MTTILLFCTVLQNFMSRQFLFWELWWLRIWHVADRK